MLEITESLLRRDPRDWEALYRNGAALAALDKSEEAVRRFQSLLNLTVSDDERGRYVEATVKHVAGRMQVMVGAMNAHTPNAVRYARQAQELGADGLMIAPPYYYTPTHDEIYNYYKAISEAVTIRVPSGLNPADTTSSLWPLRSNRAAPVSASQTRAVPSLLDVTMRVPSSLNAPLNTQSS